MINVSDEELELLNVELYQPKAITGTFELVEVGEGFVQLLRDLGFEIGEA